MSAGETACCLAAIILYDDDNDITANKISTLLKAANISVESYWPTFFSKLADKRNIGDFIGLVGELRSNMVLESYYNNLTSSVKQNTRVEPIETDVVEETVSQNEVLHYIESSGPEIEESKCHDSLIIEPRFPVMEVPGLNEKFTEALRTCKSLQEFNAVYFAEPKVLDLDQDGNPFTKEQSIEMLKNKIRKIFALLPKSTS